MELDGVGELASAKKCCVQCRHHRVLDDITGRVCVCVDLLAANETSSEHNPVNKLFNNLERPNRTRGDTNRPCTLSSRLLFKNG